jgi:hypothetical protein
MAQNEYSVCKAEDEGLAVIMPADDNRQMEIQASDQPGCQSVSAPVFYAWTKSAQATPKYKYSGRCTLYI